MSPSHRSPLKPRDPRTPAEAVLRVLDRLGLERVCELTQEIANVMNCRVQTIGHDGGVRVFVNGRAVLTVTERKNPAAPFRSKVPVKLGKGTHEIAIALDTDAGRGWGMFCCFEAPRAVRMKPASTIFPRLIP